MDEFVSFMQSVVPGWEPSPAQLDVWLAQIMSLTAAESRTVASNVPRSIYRWFGANLINYPPIDDTPASTTSKWTMVNNAGYTIPAGTQVSIARSGDQVYAFETVANVVIPSGQTLATNVILVAVIPGSDATGLGSINGSVSLLDPLTFVASITQDTVTTGGTDAETDDAYLNRLTGYLQLIAPRPILPSDFAVFARQIPGVYRATAIDGYNPAHNLLSANDASLETSVAGYVAGGNTNIAQSGAQAADGGFSMSLTAIAAGTISAVQAAASQIAVNPGETITAITSFRAATVARSCQVGIAWYTAGGAFISTSLSAGVNDATTGFTQVAVTAAAPATAAFARINPIVNGAAGAGEVHYVDKLSLRRGSTTDFVPGGTPDTGNMRTVAVAGIDQTGAPLDASHKTAVQTDLQARREINFIVNMIDPTITPIDVTYQVKIRTGYDTASVVTAVNAELAAYLNPATWGVLDDTTSWVNNPTIRYLEVAQIINAVDGVDYITTTAGAYDLQIAIHGFALGRSDITLPGPIPLPTTAGATITGAAI